MSDGQWIEQGTLDLWEGRHREQLARIEELEAKLAAERERIADLERRLKLWEPQNTWSCDGGRWPIREGGE